MEVEHLSFGLWGFVTRSLRLGLDISEGFGVWDLLDLGMVLMSS